MIATIIVKMNEQVPTARSNGIPISTIERIKLTIKYIYELIIQFNIFLPCLFINSLWSLFEDHIIIGNTIPAKGIMKLAS